MKNYINLKILIWGMLIIGTLFTSNLYAQTYLNSDSEWYNPWTFPWRAEILSDSDKAKINTIIDNVVFENRNEYMTNVNSKINTLQDTLEAKQTNEYQLLRNINILWDIRDILHTRIEDLENTVGAPTFLLTLNSATGNNSSFTLNMSKPGKWYYVILPSNSPSPSITQIKASQDINWNSVLWWSMFLTWWLNSFNVSWLSNNTSYIIYFTAKDFAWNERNTASVSFQTNSSSWNTSTANIQISSITQTWVTVAINSIVSWVWYYVILPANSSMPSASQIRLWQNSYWASAIAWNLNIVSWINRFDLTSLTQNTSYVIYYVIQDGSWNNSNIWNAEFQTGLNSEPLTITDITSSTVTFNFDSDWLRTWYYVVLPSGSDAPSILQVKNWQNSLWQSTMAWTWGLVEWNNHAVVTWFSPNTNYVLFFVVQGQDYLQRFIFKTNS